MRARVRHFPDVQLFQTTLFCASFLFKPKLLMSSLTHSSHFFFPLPLGLMPSTHRCLHAETHLSFSLCSTCPNYLNLPRLTTSATFSIPKLLYKSTDKRRYLATDAWKRKKSMPRKEGQREVDECQSQSSSMILASSSTVASAAQRL